MTSWTDYQDDISDAISESMDVDWSASVGAQAVVAWLNEHRPLMADTPRVGGADHISTSGKMVGPPSFPLHGENDLLNHSLKAVRVLRTMLAARGLDAGVKVSDGLIADLEAALATREEAPASRLVETLTRASEKVSANPERAAAIRANWTNGEEAPAGDRIVGTIAHLSSGRSELPELIASALRTQPPAREDAQPVAQWQRRVEFPSEPGATPQWNNCTHREATGHFDRLPGHEYRPLYTHPAPDALRAAEEALDPFARIASEGVIRTDKGHVTVTTCAEYFHAAVKALAALQAEQKGGA